MAVNAGTDGPRSQTDGPGTTKMDFRPGKDVGAGWKGRSSWREDLLFRVVHFLLASGTLVLLSPLLLIVSVLIKLDSPGPVIFRQTRIGRDRRGDPKGNRPDGHREMNLGGRPFTIYKFRTMRVDAEEASGPVWAKKDDLRVTRLGRWLRATRVDEIPQLWNVVRGDMSIVGPRPERPAFVSTLNGTLEAYPLRHRVLPGITGWAQVNQGSDESLGDVAAKLRYDLDYVRRRSLFLDFEIMVRTLPIMLSTVLGPRENKEPGEQADAGCPGVIPGPVPRSVMDLPETGRNARTSDSDRLPNP